MSKKELLLKNSLLVCSICSTDKREGRRNACKFCANQLTIAEMNWAEFEKMVSKDYEESQKLKHEKKMAKRKKSQKLKHEKKIEININQNKLTKYYKLEKININQYKLTKNSNKKKKLTQQKINNFFSQKKKEISKK